MSKTNIHFFLTAQKIANEILSFSLETVNDEVDHNEGGSGTEEKNDLRISQPEYSQILKDLDFSQTRMVK